MTPRLRLLLLAGCAALSAATAPQSARPKAKPKASRAPMPAPVVNAEALRPFLEALRALEATRTPLPTDAGQAPPVVRVLHFGDSHTAADGWTGRLRKRLQARFGDAGPGLVLPGRPWRGYPRETLHFLTGRTWPATSLRSAECDGWVGLTGAALEPVEGEVFGVRATFATYRIQVLGPGPFDLQAALTPAPEAPADPALPPPPFTPLTLRHETLLPDRTLRVFGPDHPESSPVLRDLQFPLPPGTRLLGVDLRSGLPGVLYDELGLNGAQLPDLEKAQPALRRALLAEARPDLLVLAYGTNEEGQNAEAAADYPARVRAVLRALRDEARAPLLVIGPLDRLGRSRRARPALKAAAQRVIAELKAASLAEGCAFWDARETMGGYGAIARWRGLGLAQRDLVHLTGPGYERLGDLLADRILGLVDARETPPRPLPAAPTRAKRKPTRRARRR